MSRMTEYKHSQVQTQQCRQFRHVKCKGCKVREEASIEMTKLEGINVAVFTPDETIEVNEVNEVKELMYEMEMR